MNGEAEGQSAHLFIFLTLLYQWKRKREKDSRVFVVGDSGFSFGLVAIFEISFMR